MTDRESQYPGRYRAVMSANDVANMQSGNQFSITLVRDDDPIEPGTPYNKASVLPDEVAALLGVHSDDVTPADAFLQIARELGRIGEEVGNAATTADLDAGIEEVKIYAEESIQKSANDLDDKIEEVKDGAAPAGYGLGENSAKAQSWNGHWSSGFYRERKYTPDNPTGSTNSSFPMWYGITCVESGGNQTNIAFSRNVSNGLTEARRYKEGNTYGEWEYVNPPMLLDVEYRTTERFLGKPVYTKLMSCGHLESKKIDLSVYDENDDFVKAPIVIRIQGLEVVNGEIESILDCSQLRVSNSTASLDIYSNQVFGDEFLCYVQLWYTY